ncbi:MAG: hypothetical protein U0795_24530 [Pirellulales bacterium]
MVSRIHALALAAVCTLGGLVGSSEAQAQVYSLTSSLNGRTALTNFLLNRPTVSPYTNLSRNDSISFGQAWNYQNLVRPANDARRRMSIAQANERSLRGLQVNPTAQTQFAPFSNQFAASRGAGQGGMSPYATGRTTQFMNTSHYYIPHSPQEARPGRPF